MNISFYFQNLKPISQNHARKHAKNGREYKTKEAVAFESRIILQTKEQLAEIFDFEASYSPYEHFLCAQVTFFMPRSKLFTKKGYISSRSGDIDNMQKYLIDSVFKRFEKIDDSAICQINAIKAPSLDNNYGIFVNLVRQDLEVLDEYINI